MKYKLYNHLNKIGIYDLEEKGLLESFEVIRPLDVSREEVVNFQYDVIEIGGEEYDKFKPFLKAVDWRTNHVGVADALVLKDKIYKPYGLLADSILRVLRKNVSRINSQQPVIVIGDIYFVSTVVTKLAVSGFVEIIVSLPTEDIQILKSFVEKIKSFVFNLNIKAVAINDLTSLNQAGFLLISNFKKESNPDAHELITYFNFLSAGAVFIDCNSLEDSSLVEDARKAEIFVIDESEILLNKYEYLLEILKNSP